MNARELKLLASAAEAQRRAREATPGLIAAAAEAGLIDVGVAEVDSPLGRLLVAVTPEGIVRIAYPDDAQRSVLEDLATRVSPRILESASMTQEARRELDEYFDGRRRRFDMAIDPRLISGFARRTLTALREVPFGTLTTYGGLASRIGSPRSARAVGNALGSNPIPIVIPCHRVVAAQGKLGGYSGGLGRKRKLLALEGAELPGD